MILWLRVLNKLKRGDGLVIFVSCSPVKLGKELNLANFVV